MWTSLSQQRVSSRTVKASSSKYSALTSPRRFLNASRQLQNIEIKVVEKRRRKREGIKKLCKEREKKTAEDKNPLEEIKRRPNDDMKNYLLGFLAERKK